MGANKKYISSDELKKHNKSDDLWISIQEKVYNVTDWAKEHPGGDVPLLNLAGHDVTDAFIAFHPGTAWKYLDRFFTGYYLGDFKVSEVSRDFRKLHSEFSKAGMFEKKGHGVIYSLCFVALLLFTCVYGVLCCDGFWIHMFSGGLLGFLWMQVAYLGHDSGHYQIMTTRGFNKFAQILSGNCLTGISIAWWKWTHNAHHISCNSLDYDPDLQHLPMLAVSSKLFHSLTSQFYGSIFICRHSFQHIQFTLNHFAANVYVGAPKGDDWFEKQTSGTIDIDCSSWMDWFFGGLQFQLEHHLFPRLPRCHLRNISPVVRELCKKHNLPYRSLSFFEANVWTLRTLRTAALEARDFSNPIPKNLLWEAVNTHG
ncbi:unnamed protein product [Fraxinus pennsylvanica]|uniref:Cytochrome b5 heme-binding domain-containing protein n=1 Tax=Fraxinus pennsylvanica TaxID=56036 RepID=A0AAD2EE45_9LAMI|nr:unnamed protein product [Fraxinus pennsylvanica]